MHCVIYTVGKESDVSIKALCDEYEKRLQATLSIEWVFIAPSRHNGNEARSEESQLIMSKLKPTDTVVLLDERGKQPNNHDFAQEFSKISGQHGRLVFVIGGAFGVTDDFRDNTRYVWSFSNLVFPHQLMRVMLLEQLYRTQAVLSGHPYHHA